MGMPPWYSSVFVYQKEYLLFLWEASLSRTQVINLLPTRT